MIQSCLELTKMFSKILPVILNLLIIQTVCGQHQNNGYQNVFSNLQFTNANFPNDKNLPLASNSPVANNAINGNNLPGDNNILYNNHIIDNFLATHKFPVTSNCHNQFSVANNLPGNNNSPVINNFPGTNNPGTNNFPGLNNFPGTNHPGTNNFPGPNNLAGTNNLPGVNNFPCGTNVPGLDTITVQSFVPTQNQLPIQNFYYPTEQPCSNGVPNFAINNNNVVKLSNDLSANNLLNPNGLRTVENSVNNFITNDWSSINNDLINNVLPHNLQMLNNNPVNNYVVKNLPLTNHFSAQSYSSSNSPVVNELGTNNCVANGKSPVNNFSPTNPNFVLHPMLSVTHNNLQGSIDAPINFAVNNNHPNVPAYNNFVDVAPETLTNFQIDGFNRILSSVGNIVNDARGNNGIFTASQNSLPMNEFQVNNFVPNNNADLANVFSCQNELNSELGKTYSFNIPAQFSGYEDPTHSKISINNLVFTNNNMANNDDKFGNSLDNAQFLVNNDLQFNTFPNDNLHRNLNNIVQSYVPILPVDVTNNIEKVVYCPSNPPDVTLVTNQQSTNMLLNEMLTKILANDIPTNNLANVNSLEYLSLMNPPDCNTPHLANIPIDNIASSWSINSVNNLNQPNQNVLTLNDLNNLPFINGFPIVGISETLELINTPMLNK